MLYTSYILDEIINLPFNICINLLLDIDFYKLSFNILKPKIYYLYDKYNNYIINNNFYAIEKINKKK